MGKKNKILISVLLLAIIGVVVTATANKVYATHIDKEYEVLEKEILEGAKECFLDKKCTGTTTSIADLKSLGYISGDLVDPVTKEEVKPDKIITKSKDTFTISLRN